MKTLIKIKDVVEGMEVLTTKANCINCGVIEKGDTGFITEIVNRFEFKFKDQYGCNSIGCVQCCKEVKEVF